MTAEPRNEACIPNPKLQPFAALVGEWDTIGSHPQLRGTVLHGRTSFAWIEGGAFLIMHSEIDEPGIPSGVAIFGSDDSTGEYFMLYFDERTVSRKYDVAFHGRTMTWRRDEAGFSQRLTCAIGEDGNTIISKGELSRNGTTWEPDLELTYTRAGRDRTGTR